MAKTPPVTPPPAAKADERLDFEMTLDRLTQRLARFTGKFDAQLRDRQRKLRRWSNLCLVPLAAFILMFVRSCPRCEEDDCIAVLWGFLAAASLIAVLVLRGLSRSSHVEGLVRAAGLDYALGLLADDLHPAALITGRVDFRPTDSLQPYRTATSALSGATKNYYKMPWLSLRTRLRDGTLVAIKLKEKMKTKGGSTVIEEQQFLGRLRIDPTLYEVTPRGASNTIGPFEPTRPPRYEPDSRVIYFGGTIRDGNNAHQLGIGIAAALRWAYDSLQPCSASS